LTNNIKNTHYLEENSKTWFDVWKLIDDFDSKHVESDYPYQQREIEAIINNTTKALSKTTFIAKDMELNFVQIENLLNDIIRSSESFHYHNDDKKNILFLKTDILKDEIHRLYTKYNQYSLREKTRQPQLAKQGVIR